MRRQFLEIAVMFFLIGVYVLASDICLARTESATTIVPDDFLTIQEAISNAVEGDIIFVETGIYYEHVVVNKTVSILGEDVDTTIIDGNNTGARARLKLCHYLKKPHGKQQRRHRTRPILKLQHHTSEQHKSE